MKKIAIIGAGLSGLTLGQKLSQKADVCVFEKARGVGGRMTTRYADLFVFDHGAPYWKVETKEFKNFLVPLMGSVVAPWNGNIITLGNNNTIATNISSSSYFVALPNMNSLCKYLAIDLNIKTQCEIIRIKATNEKKWRLISSNNDDLGVYDRVISTAPAAQTLKLFSDYLPKNHGLYKSTFDSCFSLMIGLHQPWEKEWIAANVCNSPIKWIGVNSTKPGRNHNVTCLVIHSDPKWTKANIDRDIQEVQDLLLNELDSLITLDIKNLSYVSTHRWLYSNVHPLNNDSYYVDLDLGLFAVGDWSQMSDIETVWLNAKKAADFITAEI
jgi:predicted NAD/FAD-dependent oxidoreductase